MNDPSILDPRVRVALDDAAIAYEVLPCPPDAADTAEFCAAFGVPAAEACNTILVAVKGNPRWYVGCLARADTKIDCNRKVSALVGVKRLSFASQDEAAEVTGQMIGGVTVAGLPSDVRIYIDTRVLENERIVIGGGNRTSKVRLDPRELLKLPCASVQDITVPR